MFNLINYKKIYKILCNDTEVICQIINQSKFHEKFMENNDFNVLLIFYHLLTFVYAIIKEKKGRNSAEKTIKKLFIETIVRAPNEYKEYLLDICSNIITRYSSLYSIQPQNTEEIDINFPELLSKGICEIYTNTDDPFYFTDNNFCQLISSIKDYLEQIIPIYEDQIIK